MGGPRDLEGLFGVFLNTCKTWKDKGACQTLGKDIEQFLTSTASKTAIPRPSIYSKGYNNIRDSLKKVQEYMYNVFKYRNGP